MQAIQLFGPEWMVKELEKELLKQRGNGPTYLEIVVVVYVMGTFNCLIISFAILIFTSIIPCSRYCLYT